MATPTYKLSKSLTGHTKDVRSVCVLSDGKIVSGSRDHSIRVWDPVNNYSSTELNGHSHFVGTLVNLPPSLLLSERIFASGGNDKVICVWEKSAIKSSSSSPSSNNNNNNNNNNKTESQGGSPSLMLLGHNDSVSTLGVTNDGLIISGSWDKTIKVWENGECLTTLSGHEASIWSVIGLSNGSIVSASADKTIKIWRQNSKGNYSVEKTLKNHKDCVRGLAVIPDLGFISCSNDGTVYVWTVTGDLIQELSGHSSFVYSVSVVPGIGFASVGEDRTLRIWKDGENIQTLTHPSGVWDVAVSPNGDIVTGCADGTAYVWSKNESKWANQQEIQHYQDNLAAQTIMSDNVGDIKMNELPDSAEALITPGTKDGELKVVKSGKVAEAYQWSASESKWIKIGEVVDANAASRNSSKGVLNGREYDYIFDVDVGDGVMYKIGYDLAENPYTVAQDFLLKNDLGQEFLDQVAQFIIKNSEQTGMTFEATPQLSDPFTGNNRYIPGQSNNQPSIPVYRPPVSNNNNNNNNNNDTIGVTLKPTSLIPQASYTLFETANSESLLTKVLEFNQQLMNDPSTKSLALDEDDHELSMFKGILATLKETSRYHSSSFSDNQYKVLFKMLQWPADKVYTILDVIRVMVLHPGASKTFEKMIIENRVSSKYNILVILFRIIQESKVLNNQMLIMKIFSNMLRHEPLRVLLAQMVFSTPQLFDSIKSTYSSISPPTSNKSFSISFSTFLLNISVYSQYNQIGNEIINRIVDSLHLVISTETDPDLLMRCICGLGTILMFYKDYKPSSAVCSSIINSISKVEFNSKFSDSIQLISKLL